MSRDRDRPSLAVLRSACSRRLARPPWHRARGGRGGGGGCDEGAQEGPGHLHPRSRGRHCQSGCPPPPRRALPRIRLGCRALTPCCACSQAKGGPIDPAFLRQLVTARATPLRACTPASCSLRSACGATRQNVARAGLGCTRPVPAVTCGAPGAYRAGRGNGQHRGILPQPLPASRACGHPAPRMQVPLNAQRQHRLARPPRGRCPCS